MIQERALDFMKLFAQFNTVVEYFELEIKNFEEFLVVVFVLLVDEVQNFLEVTFEEKHVSF